MKAGGVRCVCGAEIAYVSMKSGRLAAVEPSPRFRVVSDLGEIVLGRLEHVCDAKDVAEQKRRTQ
jgi:hypothetical protein